MRISIVVPTSCRGGIMFGHVIGLNIYHHQCFEVANLVLVEYD